MSIIIRLSRRDFLEVSAITGVGLALGIYLGGCRERVQPTSTPTGTPQPSMTPEPTPTSEVLMSIEPSVYLVIDNRGSTTITVPRSELGQGVRTALAMIVAEELEADWSTVQVVQAEADRKYGDQLTGGSQSVMETYDTLRHAGAVGRELLIQAAAQIWGVEAETCNAENGEVVHQETGQRLSYAQLVETAATMPIPDRYQVQLKNPQDFRIIGTSVGRIDNPDIVSGSAFFGFDIKRPGMLYAAIARCPFFGGKASSYDDSQTRAIQGVRDVFEIKSGVAVVADNTWAAIKGRQALEIVWDEGPNRELSSAALEQELLDLTKRGTPSSEEGVPSEFLEAVYIYPYQAHAPMEPMNCVADVRQDHCEIWVPTQNPQEVRSRVVSLTGLPSASVRVNVTLVGGAFGRRLENEKSGRSPTFDYVTEAIQCSEQARAPVQVIWTREDDLHHDLFHPLSCYHLSASLTDPERIIVRPYESGAPIPHGYWRAVANVPEAFAHECFVDELAHAMDTDPYELRREWLTGLSKEVLEVAATRAGWGEPLPDRWGRGIAYHATWGVTQVAQVAEVEVKENGDLRVHRVVCAINCGIVINPDMVVAQMEGGIVFGLTAVLKGEITIEGGQVQQSNFHNYPLFRMDEMPNIEVYIIPSERSPTGVGEMGVPPIAPAVANAVFAATGKRIRRLPIRREDLI